MVYHSDTELIYPMRVTPHLRNLRGDAWRRLIDRVMSTPDASLDHLAFCLLVVRLCNCINCHTNSYRALRGCTMCAKHAVLRYRDPDSELIRSYETALREIRDFLEDGVPIVEATHELPPGGKIYE